MEIENRPADYLLAKHAKSFYWAGQFLTPAAYQKAAIVYAFCRYIDDLCDDAPSAAEAEANLKQALTDMRNPHTDNPVIKAFLYHLEQHPLSVKPAYDLIYGVQLDVKGHVIQDEQDLIRYAYLVAGTVGLMMSDILSNNKAAAHAFALDLGIAMQMTNIARDVLEDAHLNRLYLPRTWLPTDFSLSNLLAGNELASSQAYAAVCRLLELAEIYYRSADKGLSFLPGRSRLAILCASRLYEAIGTKIKRIGPNAYWQQRTFINRRSKMWHTLRACKDFSFNPIYWPMQWHSVPAHDPHLHGAIANWHIPSQMV